MLSHHIETSPLICRADQLIGFSMTRTLVFKRLILQFLLVIIFQALKEIRLNHLQMLMIMSQFGLFICIPIWIFIDTPVMTQDVNLVGTSYPFT